MLRPERLSIGFRQVTGVEGTELVARAHAPLGQHHHHVVIHERSIAVNVFGPLNADPITELCLSLDE